MEVKTNVNKTYANINLRNQNLMHLGNIKNSFNKY